MIDPTVRPATVDDRAELTRLEAAARASIEGSRGAARWLDEHPSIGERWADVIARDVVLLATLPVEASQSQVEVPVGFLQASFDPAGAIITIEQVFVLPDVRQLGFGDELLAAAGEAGRRRGATLIEGAALPGDRETKNLYERAGITARLIVVSKPL